MPHRIRSATLGLIVCALLSQTAPPLASAAVGDPAAVEVDWDRFRHYVAAHVWVADIDFRDGEVQGLHVCIGFNAFRERAALEALGLADRVPPDATLQAAAYALTFNTRAAMEAGRAALIEARESDRYGALEGDDRLAFVRGEMWRRVAEDEAVESAVRETAGRLDVLIERFGARGWVDLGRRADDPAAFFSSAGILLGAPESVEAAFDDPGVAAATDPETARAAFAEAFGRHVAEARIPEEAERPAYAATMAAEAEKVFASGGVFAVRIDAR